MKYYNKGDLEAISIAEFSEELKSNPAINYTDSLITSADSDFVLDTADVFRQGVCQLFARALQDKFGYSVYKIEVGKSFHIFCKSEDKLTYIDVRGKTTDFHEFIAGSDLPAISCDVSKPYQFETDDFDGDYYEIGLAFAKAIITRDEKRYQI